ncbi:MAG: T9SS type A sorting domain-containing protein [Ferruginibacter sp.]
MKKILSLIVLLVTIFPYFSKAQYITIPDPALRANIVMYHPSCVNATHQLDTTCAEILNATYFAIGEPVNDWQGFQYFRNLVTLMITDDMSSFPVIPSTVKYLTITSNTMTDANIPAFPAGLTWLDIQSNTLNHLPALPPLLTHLRCFGTNITTLPTLPSGLTYLDVSWNYLDSLPYPLPAGIDTLDCSMNSMHYAFQGLPAGLKYLNCFNSGFISSLGPSFPSTLKYINCSNSELLTSLPALPPQLEYFEANNCGFTSLPALPATLREMYVFNNHMTSLPALPSSLLKLDCHGNQLTSLPVLPASLQWLLCHENQLTSLPALPASLQSLSCNNNQLTSLPTLPPLYALDCSFNQLTSLPALLNLYNGLYCNNNLLTSLPDLPNTITTIYCDNNQLTSLPTLPHSLTELICHSNNLNCLPFLPYGLQYVYMDNAIMCVPNKPTNCYFQTFQSFAVVPVCDPTNNVNHCQVFPTMTGYVYNDNNNNNIKDPGEPTRANIRLVLSDGTITFTDDDGLYKLWADTLGTFTLDCNSAIYFSPSPAHYTYNFSTYDTLQANNFGMQATATVDSLTIYVSPLEWAARPGFSYPFRVWYENAGTTSLNPDIVLNYDNTRLIYDSSSNAAVNNTGTALQLTEPMVPGARNNFIAYFRIKPTAVLGDTIFTNAHATANGIGSYDSIFAQVRGSYDPNEKLATPRMSRADVVAGKYIDYTIGFQNTGTDTAFNVVVTDTLNNGLLDINSLKIISSSHNCRITQIGKIIYFEFNNIMLPDSNVNEMKSHGFVRFRLRPRSFVSNGTDIGNKASIYFDYNLPVITNTAITQIMNPTSPVPLTLISFDVIRQTKNTANAYWNTVNEINVNGFDIEMSLDGRNYTRIASQHAKGGSYNSYSSIVAIPGNDIIYFRLKMMDADGRAVYSKVVTLKNNGTNDAFGFAQNPVNDLLTISIQDEKLKNTTARIIDLQGKLMKTVLLQHEVVSVDVSDLASGTYILQTIKGSSKFVVKH